MERTLERLSRLVAGEGAREDPATPDHHA